MKGIKTSLLRAFLTVIAGLSFGSVVLLIVQYYVIHQYKTLSDTTIAEYRLVDSVSGLIDAYNTRFISTNTNETKTGIELKKTRDEVVQLTTFLDNSIVDQTSKDSYVGLKNSIDAVTSTINNSLNNVSKGDIESFTTDYYQATKQYQFVRDNGTALIFNELKYASSIRDTINRIYFWSQILNAAILLLIIISCIAYVIQFSRRLTAPILRLQQLALLIAAGHLDVIVDSDILEQKNELGSLAKSFQEMTTGLANANNTVIQSQQQIKERADESERMNKLMIGRELEMIKLKKRISELEESK